VPFCPDYSSLLQCPKTEFARCEQSTQTVSLCSCFTEKCPVVPAPVAGSGISAPSANLDIYTQSLQDQAQFCAKPKARMSDTLLSAVVQRILAQAPAPINVTLPQPAAKATSGPSASPVPFDRACPNFIIAFDGPPNGGHFYILQWIPAENRLHVLDSHPLRQQRAPTSKWSALLHADSITSSTLHRQDARACGLAVLAHIAHAAGLDRQPFLSRSSFAQWFVSNSTLHAATPKAQVPPPPPYRRKLGAGPPKRCAACRASPCICDDLLNNAAASAEEASARTSPAVRPPALTSSPLSESQIRSVLNSCAIGDLIRVNWRWTHETSVNDPHLRE